MAIPRRRPLRFFLWNCKSNWRRRAGVVLGVQRKISGVPGRASNSLRAHRLNFLVFCHWALWGLGGALRSPCMGGVPREHPHPCLPGPGLFRAFIPSSPQTTATHVSNADRTRQRLNNIAPGDFTYFKPHSLLFRFWNLDRQWHAYVPRSRLVSVVRVRG